MRLPEAFTTRQAMAIGTAGYTAMLCVLALERHGLRAGDGSVLVTGATGGVGSVAVALLARLGHRVAAATGKSDQADYLKRLGAVEIVDRAELAGAGQALAEGTLECRRRRGRQPHARQCAGADPLRRRRRRLRSGPRPRPAGHVMPFILRGVTLAGIDSVMAPIALRRTAWERLARDLDPAALELITEEVPLERAIEKAEALMAGRVRGRVVVTVSAAAAAAA